MTHATAAYVARRTQAEERPMTILVLHTMISPSKALHIPWELSLETNRRRSPPGSIGDRSLPPQPLQRRCWQGVIRRQPHEALSRPQTPNRRRYSKLFVLNDLNGPPLWPARVAPMRLDRKSEFGSLQVLPASLQERRECFGFPPASLNRLGN
jgi:hypothetical protein